MAQSGKPKLTRRLAASVIEGSAALDNMWADVDRIRAEILGDTVPCRPPGAVTHLEYATRYGLRSTRAREELERMVAVKKLKRLYTFLPNARGSVCKTVIYAPVRPK